MKTYQELIAQEPVFLHHWDNKEEVLSSFDGERWEWDSTENVDRDVTILFASYSSANYTGDAFVLYERDGALYEVNGGHCSCYGLEGQWNPEEVSFPEIEHRLLKGTFGEVDSYGSENEFKEKLCEFLGVEFIKNQKSDW